MVGVKRLFRGKSADNATAGLVHLKILKMFDEAPRYGNVEAMGEVWGKYHDEAAAAVGVENE
jgi:hypothetical protein